MSAWVGIGRSDIGLVRQPTVAGHRGQPHHRLLPRGRIRDGGRRGPGHHGVLSAIQTYEAPLDRHLEEAGFRGRSHVTILLKEALVRVAQPALLPAVR